MDDANQLWHRNPSSGESFISLLSEVNTASFYPDFIVWKKGSGFCLNTKGARLPSDAVARKLLDVMEDGATKVQVRFITEGEQTELRGKSIKGGYTVWKVKPQGPAQIHVADIDAAVVESLR